LWTITTGSFNTSPPTGTRLPARAGVTTATVASMRRAKTGVVEATFTAEAGAAFVAALGSIAATLGGNWGLSFAKSLIKKPVRAPKAMAEEKKRVDFIGAPHYAGKWECPMKR
jgi:hypothetical protein